MPWYFWIIIAYLIITNMVAVFLTIYDKRIAIKSGHRAHEKVLPHDSGIAQTFVARRKRRVPERTLLLWAALSGCVVMYITMQLIHHKTRKPKFMVGIPVIFILELAAVGGIIYLL